VVPKPAHEEQEAQREIQADDAVWNVVTDPASDQGRAAVASPSVHYLSQSPGRRPRPPDSPRRVRDVIAARGSSGVPRNDVMPAAAAAPFPAAAESAAAAAAAAVSRRRCVGLHD